MSDDTVSRLTVYVNGKLYEVVQVDPRMTLLQFLRQNRLTGTKLGCGEGGCGACTVMVSFFDPDTQSICHHAANACLTPICAVDGCAVTTVEGIGGMNQGLHPVQQRIASAHGSQCGFCTPGIVMSIYSMLRSNPNATPHEIEEALDGNLCRCTGYRPIIDAARSLSNNKTPPNKANGSGGCCGGGGAGGGCPCKLSGTESNSSSEQYVSEQVSLAEAMAAKGRTEPIFPPALMRRKPTQLLIKGEGVTWHQPLTLEQLLDLKFAHPEARLVVGNTEVGIETKFKFMEYSVLINPLKVKELRVLEESAGSKGITVGAAVTLNRLKAFITQLTAAAPASQSYKHRGFTAIADMLSWFASNQIRNVACVGGNICTASPISDLNPLLIACGAVLNLRSTAGARQVPIRDFFLAYRKVDMQPCEVLESVHIPYTSEFEFVLPFKQAKRREDDISIVNAGVRFLLTPDEEQQQWRVKECTLAYGGMAPTTVRANKAAAALVGQSWTFSSVEAVFPLLKAELALAQNVPGGQPEYRMALTVSFLFKAYLAITQQLAKHVLTSEQPTALPPVPELDSPSEASGAVNFLSEPKPSTRGQQSFIPRTDGIQHARPTPHEMSKEAYGNTNKVVGESLKHKSAELQVTGEATFTDDIPFPPNTVHAALVLSTRVHAKVTSIDTSEAERCPGFVAYFSQKDVVGSNNIGVVEKDEKVFAEGEVTNVGAILGVVICETHEQAVYAARKVSVTYEDLPFISCMMEAIAAGHFYEPQRHLINGDVEKERAESDVIVSGTFNVGSQEHFYLETNCTRVLPLENNQLEVHSSCQNLAYMQSCVASVCNLPFSKVHTKCRRMGGAFGGKESRPQPIGVTAALAAHLLKRPVSISVERDTDMSITGQRHSFHISYEAGITSAGKLKFLKAKLYGNGGNSKDLSVSVVERGILHLDSVYRWPALDIEGKACRTNKSSNTAFRGFGSPQVFSFCEMIMEHLARASKLDVDHVRQLNLYQEGDRIPCGQELVHYYVPRLLRDVNTLASVAERRATVEEFNRTNRWRKRGICVLGTKYGINFEARFLNQGGSLVHIYTDGTVLIALGGNEMGQGLYTKMVQVAAQCFNIPHEWINIAETATTTIPNAISTAGSMNTDLYGMAVLDACEQLVQRLAPYREKMVGASWQAIVNAAFFDRVDLCAHGFYAVAFERCGMTWDTPEPQHPFNYFTQGAACTEVEIDCLTGDYRVLRADVLMDLGKSINPAIDIGQIEGAFMQGLGYCTMEELIWGDADHPWVKPGHLFTKGPGTYKIPAFNDVPIDFRVHLADTDNRFAVHSSKAVGEPPFYLGCSVFFAIQNAVFAARAQNGQSSVDYHLEMPATSERIRMGCADRIADICTDGHGATFEAKASY